MTREKMRYIFVFKKYEKLDRGLESRGGGGVSLEMHVAPFGSPNVGHT